MEGRVGERGGVDRGWREVRRKKVWTESGREGGGERGCRQRVEGSEEKEGVDGEGKGGWGRERVEGRVGERKDVDGGWKGG